jgi:hypothetical protein
MPPSASHPESPTDSASKAPVEKKAPQSDPKNEGQSDGPQVLAPDDHAPEESGTGSPASGVGSDGKKDEEAPPLPDEHLPDSPLPNSPAPDGPPLPAEPLPQPEPEDDGWDCQFDPNTQAWFFFNRFTGKTQWENPRVPDAAATSASAVASDPQPPPDEKPAAGGYNPAIHGNWDPNAWYAKVYKEDNAVDTMAAAAPPGVDGAYGATATFNRFTGQFQAAEMGPDRHTDEAKSRRQMNAYFDVDAAANTHDGRSLKAERANKKPSSKEVKAYNEKRRAKKEEKRRAWLRD